MHVAHRVLTGKPERKIPLGNVGIEEGIILKWIIKN
jgi:hypothetical protein